MLKTRLFTALWGIPLLLAAIWLGQPWFTVLFGVWGLVAAWEFYNLLAALKVKPITWFGLAWTALVIASPYFSNLTSLIITSAVMLPLICCLFSREKEQVFANWAWTMAGILYIGWLLSYTIMLRGIDPNLTFAPWVTIMLFSTFAGDSAAYFTGRAWGKHRMAPQVSPHKTWEGAAGGLLWSIIAVLVLSWWLNMPLGYGPAVLLGLLISIFGQLGDLAKSLFKRNVGVKDSGKIVPGHGGALDRLDSILFSGVVVYYFALAFNNGWLRWLG